MASERRVEANRRNARNSTGPRSDSGKKRAARNALRHGLTKPISSAEFNRMVKRLARQIARDADGSITPALALEAAEADLELDRVRRVKVALIERAVALGRFDVPPRFVSPKDEMAWILLHCCDYQPWKTRPKYFVDTVPPMPAEDPERTAEGVRRILPELTRLMRYETRAVSRRDRAIRAIVLAGNSDEQ
jgi:hypothetical protein